MSSNKFSYATATNVSYLEDQYEKFRKDPMTVEDSWRKFFEGYEFAMANGAGAEGGSGASESGDQEAAKVEAYINAYRVLGHLSAHVNPLAPKPPLRHDMSPANHGLKDVNKSRKFVAANLPSNAPLTFDEINQMMQETYCGKIGAEFRDNDNIEFVKWIQDKMESCRNRPKINREQKLEILDTLVKAEGFEGFLQARFLGQKRFSLEGAESFMPLLETLVRVASAQGVEEVILGMAHRGRLGTLCNFIGKTYETMLKKFEGSEFNPFQIDGDVKYHLGFAGERDFSGKKVTLYLSPNPSHLEIVNPVVEGFARARQRLTGDQDRKKVLPLLIHGDAAFMGQGLVAETLNLAELGGYTTGGTIHVIINNQVGFTTDPEDSRSCTYASGIAKILKAPVLHVNADDPEAVIWTAQLAAEYRQKFRKDFVIDLIGYRRHGHNETDEPGFTQPSMYKIISKHPSVLTQYGERLISEGVLTSDDLKKRQADFRARLQNAYDQLKAGDTKGDKFKDKYPKVYDDVFHPIRGDEAAMEKSVKTGVPIKVLQDIGKKIVSVPSGFQVHPKLTKLLEQRSKMVDTDGSGVDWPMAELLAFGSLAKDGHHVRLSGQDCQRGTFSSRQAVLRDYDTGKPHYSMNYVAPGQAPVEILNSPLSELGVMGFEFGYTVADPQALVLWEGQFGDFVNGAQIVIDQFLVASEAKWGQTSGLVLLLPHGYEGMGPEHSSGRPERFLQLCGNANIQVAIPTTAAQYFHILRRQICREFRKPLVIMSPKSLLRHAKVVSPIEDFERGQFEEVLDDVRIKDPKSVKRVVFCTGKLFYELMEATSTAPEGEVALVRIEQLYPFPTKKIATIISRYKNTREAIWAQEEPKNMGAWTFVRSYLEDLLPESVPLRYVGRRDSGTTAEGATKAHTTEQARIINEAVNPTVGAVTVGVSPAKTGSKK
jgi:2-oxoglutarate dehydrogenase E1 component